MLAYSGIKSNVVGIKRDAVMTVTYDSSYATGGLTLDTKKAQIKTVECVLPESTDSYTFRYDHPTGKLLAFVRTTGAQVTATTDLSAVSVKVYIRGT